MKGLKSLILLSIFLLPLFCVNVSTADESSQIAQHFLNKTPVTKLDAGTTIDQAMKLQAQYLAKISNKLGPLAGYKAGLTSAVSQKKFGVSHPLRGTLYKKMLLKSGTVLPAKFGVRPMSEGDILVRVGSDSINKAKTAKEALKCIDAALPFIELPDLLFGKGVKITGPRLAAINVAARSGIVGNPIFIKPTSEWFDRLKNFKVQILDCKGNLLVEGKGSNLLGHPLNVVLWIRDSLAAEGKTLKKGDLLSLGTITKLMPTKANTTVQARYVGLDPNGPVDILVKFK